MSWENFKEETLGFFWQAASVLATLAIIGGAVLLILFVTQYAVIFLERVGL